MKEYQVRQLSFNILLDYWGCQIKNLLFKEIIGCSFFNDVFVATVAASLEHVPHFLEGEIFASGKLKPVTVMSLSIENTELWNLVFGQIEEALKVKS